MSEQTPISAEEIEKTLNHQEEEEQQDFDQWFNSVVNDGEDKPKKKEVKNDETEEVKDVKPNEETEEVKEVKPNEETKQPEPVEEIKSVEPDKSNDETKQTVEVKSDEEVKQTETVEEGEQSTTEEVKEVKQPEPVKPVKPTNETDHDSDNEITEVKEEPEVSNPKPYTLSDIQPKKYEKQNITITKHRKHRTRKTELSASKPEKQPIVIQENEHGKVEIGNKKGEKLSDEELEKKLQTSAQKLVSNIQNQVEEMEANGNCRKIDEIEYTPGSEKYNIFKHYLLDPLLVPKRCTTRFNLNEYINSITIFNYNCFDSPNVAMSHPIPEKVIFMEKLNSLFDYKFVNAVGGEFHFADLDTQLLNFISIHKDLGTLSFEYKLIRAALGKLILSLNTDVELALRDNTRPTLNSAFKQVIVKDVQYMKHLQNNDGKTFISWKSFLDTMLNVSADKLIYVHDNYRNLNIKLEKAYSTDFLLENLLANMLKCYLPSVALNYFYAVKSIYIIARLVSIYIQLGLFKNKQPAKVMEELFTIGVAGVIIYENKSFIYKQATRTLPNYDKPLSNETKLYILNHLMTGGQYYILKMLEESLPVIATDLVK